MYAALNFCSINIQQFIKQQKHLSINSMFIVIFYVKKKTTNLLNVNVLKGDLEVAAWSNN